MVSTCDNGTWAQIFEVNPIVCGVAPQTWAERMRFKLQFLGAKESGLRMWF